MKSVSACIVTYNNKDKIAVTIRSVLENTKGVELKLYVVDNCSSDGTAEYIEKEFDGVTVIRSKRNAGFGAGHNMILPFLDSDYHIVINPDIILESDAISELVRIAEEDEKIGLLSPNIVFEDGSVQLLGKRNPTVRYLGVHFFTKDLSKSKLMSEYCMTDMPDDKPFEITNATGCFMFFRTSVFRQLGGFDERFFMYLEDCDIARRASEISKVLFVPTVTVIHLWERASKKSRKLLMIHIQSILKYFLKWGIKF